MSDTPESMADVKRDIAEIQRGVDNIAQYIARLEGFIVAHSLIVKHEHLKTAILDLQQAGWDHAADAARDVGEAAVAAGLITPEEFRKARGY